MSDEFVEIHCFHLALVCVHNFSSVVVLAKLVYLFQCGNKFKSNDDKTGCTFVNCTDMIVLIVNVPPGVTYYLSLL